MEQDEFDSIWKAFSDPSRRRVLDLLTSQPMTTGQIAERLPVSRIAVMKHLKVLQRAGLTVSRKRGRERWNYVNFVPIRQLYERWLGPGQDQWAASLIALKRQVESTENGGVLRDSDNGQLPLCIDIQQDISLRTEASRVFEALTDSVSAWWGFPYLSPETRDLVLEPKLGGLFYEIWGENSGATIATVTALIPNRRLELTGRFHMEIVYGVANFQLVDESEGSTLLQFSFRAIGHLTSDEGRAMQGGWADLLEVRLKAFLEEDQSLGIKSE